MALPEIILPRWLGKIGARLPGTPPRFVLVTTLNTMLKRGTLPADMSLFAGRKFEIAVLDAGITVRFGATAERFTLENFSGAPDLRLAANGIDFMRMILREEDPDTLFFSRKLQIEGDTELGLITKNLLDCVEWPLSNWLLRRQASH